MKQIPLTKIGFFNPGRLNDEEIEQMFITRVPFFEYLFKKIIEEKPDSIPQHYLVIGQRGMGKTSLLIRIAAELRKKPYSNSYIALTFPEEQYNVDRLSKFWLNCMDALADALDKENNKDILKALDSEISELAKNRNTGAAAILESFKKWTQKIKRRPVLLVDNLNLIFDKINKEEQHQLRAVLMSAGSPILVGASATTIDQTVDYGAPFYDAFQISYLKKLSFEESLDVLINLARITGNKDFESKMYQHRGRLEALYQLTGGTPRTIAVLFPLIQGGFSEKIQTDLDALLDTVTPLYKARFEELAPQLQVVLDAVALHWDPINLEQLRTITQLENAQLSPQLKRLVDVGWLQKLDAYNAKGGAYELSERFFNIWYLMRRSSRRMKRELYCLTKFLESFYGENLKDLAKERLNSKCEDANHIALDLALAEAVRDKKISKQLKDKSYKTLFNIGSKDRDVLKQFTIPENITNKRISDLWEESNRFYKKGKFTNSIKSLLEILNIDETDKKAWKNLGNIYQENLGRYKESEDAYKKAISFNEEDSDTWCELGNLYQDELKKYAQAEEAYKKAISIDKNFAFPWYGLGNLYHNYLLRYRESEEAYKKAISMDPEACYAWYGLGNLYQYELGRYSEAEEAYKKAISLDEKDGDPWYGLGSLYQYELERYSEAEEAYKKAISLDEKDGDSWYGLGNLYQNKLGRYSEAEEAYKKAISLDEKDGDPWHGLGSLYQNKLGRYSEAEEAYKKAISLNDKDSDLWHGLGNLYQYELNRYKESEEAYKKAISLDKKFVYSWYGLGNLYQYELNRYNESEEAYKKAISLDEKYAFPWDALGKLYQDKLKKYNEAEEAYKKAISLDESNSFFWNTLGNLYQDYLHRYSEAEIAYQKAIKSDSSNPSPKYNLVFLWRDKMDRINDARVLFDSIKRDDELNDSHYLNEALFAFYDTNIGIAESFLQKAIDIIKDEKLPNVTEDDWYRAASIIIKLGYGETLLKIFTENQWNIIMRPFYVAIEGLTNKDEELFLNSVAAEVREPALIIMDLMRNYMK